MSYHIQFNKERFFIKETKEINKSIRITKRVYDYVNRIEGEEFNQKFENMVNLCFEEIPK